MITMLSVFSGIGGLDLGLDRAGIAPVGQIEIDPWCRRVLAHHWPEVPRHDDITTAPAWWASVARPGVDVVAGGPPCQPNSLAGKGLAQADPRWLWPAMARLIGAVRPRAVIIEGVPGLRTRGLVDIMHDLSGLGFHGFASVLSAAQLGAPHLRKRIFILAYAERDVPDSGGPGLDPWRSERPGGVPGGPEPHRRNDPAGHGWWAAEPDVGRVAYGVPGRVDRLRGLGNAVVPQVAEHIGRIVIERLSTQTITHPEGS